jgi:acetyl esterase/lipase
MLISACAGAQNVFPLYPAGVPNSKPSPETETKTVTNGSIRYGKISQPTLEVWLPPAGKANGTAIVICPGGGYSIVSYTNEGTNIAEAFNKIGVTAFILKYRMPSDSYIQNKTIAPLQDAQMAIKTIRERAKEWNIDTAKVGIIGFSAGGHVASTALTHFNTPVIDNANGTSLRPTFGILGYPVVNLTDSLMHKGSRDNLLGPSPSQEMIRLYSNDLQVTRQTPPTLLFQAADDRTVKVGNSIAFFEALVKNGVQAEMHIYPKGGHGFGINNRTTPDQWIDRVENWMKANGWVK